MDPISDLLRTYGAWRSLAEEEAAAIQAGDWTGVESCQNLKDVLQNEILRFSGLAEAHWRRHPETELAGREALRSILEELMNLEEGNARSIADQRALGQASREELNKVTRTLRSVHQYYGSARSAVWQAYS